MKKNKYISIKFLESFILVVIFTITILSNTIYKSILLQEHLSNNKDTGKGFIKLHDNYDGLNNRMTISEFFKSKDSTEKLRNLYNTINENDKFKYYEIATQCVQVIGEFTGNSELVNGPKEFINQKKNGKILNSLNSIQLGEKASTYLNVENKINRGKYFSKEDYYLNSNNEVPVVLGNMYSDTYHIGDSFEIIYLGCIKLKCNVIGFIEKSSSFCINQKYNLDDKIVIPALNIKQDVSLKEKNKDIDSILYSIKNTGYILYNNDDEYNRYITIINDIAKKINIDWSYIGKDINPFKENPIKLSITTIKIIKIISLIISLVLMISVYILEKQIYKSTNFSSNRKKRVLLKTKKNIILAMQMMILYIITCFAMSIYFKNDAMYYILISMQKQMVIFFIFGFIGIVYMLNIYTKKYKTIK